MDRRDFLKTGSVSAAAAAAGSMMPSAARADHHERSGRGEGSGKRYQNGRSPWPISLDTATIGWGDLEKSIDVAAEAGFDAIEPWMRQLEEYEASGGSLKDLGKKVRDRGLIVPSVIGLWGAIPTQRNRFESSLEDTRRRMRMAADLGAEHVQTIPAQEGEMDLDWASEAYRRLLEIGLNDYDINPALVFVAMFTIRTIGEAAHVALNADHPKAKIIPDTFHMHISGSGLSGIRHLSGDFIAIMQFNDAPDSPPRDQLNDGHRVFPGDGILPLEKMLQDLHATGFERCVSLELYNRKYHEMDALEAAKMGLKRTVDVIDRAIG